MPSTATVQFHSRVLGRHVTYGAILPDVYRHGPGPYAVLYQLHGASDDYRAWLQYSNLVRHVSPWPLLVILPDGALSFWMNYNPRERYEDFLIEELMPQVAATFRVRPGPAAIGGLSMGGYGALYLALKHPDRFASAWGHSGAYFTEDDFLNRGLGTMPPADPRGADLFRLAQQAAARQAQGGRLPALGFDCGTEDFLLDHNRRFHTHLDSLGMPHIYREHPGAHTWDYWDVHVQEALAHHAQALGLTRAEGQR